MAFEHNKGRGEYQEGKEDTRPMFLALVGLILGGIFGYQIGKIFIWGVIGSVIGLLITLIAGELLFSVDS